MATYMEGLCPECGARSAAAIRLDCITEEHWAETRTEFEASDLITLEFESPARVKLESCRPDCSRKRR
jgi:hypothetical protein